MRSLALACGIMLVAGAAPAPAIFHGRAVDPASSPWMVAFRARSTVCGGAVIAPDRVLTAAHCVAGVSPRRLRLLVGGQPLSAGPRRVGWRGAAFPRDFKLIPSLTEPLNPLSSSSVNDIAIVQLDRPLAGVPPLRIADAPPAPGETTIAYGRGDTGDGPSDALMAVRQRAIGAAQCGAVYRRAFRSDRHLCGLDPTPAGGQACAGDSGGPVVAERDGAPQLVGVVTWGGEVRGRGCGEGLPDVSELAMAHRALLTGSIRAFAPWAHQRVRVRRRDGVLTCVIGRWTPRGARFRVTWFRPAPGLLPDVDLPLRARRIRARRAPLGCAVTAITAGGRTIERSYNAR